MTASRGCYDQAEQLILLGREHRLDIDGDWLRGMRIGSKWYSDPISLTVALLSAFDKVGIKVPDELRKRPDDYV